MEIFLKVVEIQFRMISKITVFQKSRGAWLARLAECPSLRLSSGPDVRVLRLSPVLGSVLRAESA